MNSHPITAYLAIAGLGILLGCKKEADNTTPTPVPAQLTISGLSPASGPVGTRVVISGTGFGITTSANTVRFGSTVATLDSVSATRLITRVPAGATTGRVSVAVSSSTVQSGVDFTVTTTTSTTTTPAPTAPTFSTLAADQTFTTVAVTSVGVRSSLTGFSNQVINQHGHVWSKTGTPTLTTNVGKTELGSLAITVTLPYSFSSSLTGLDPATSYVVRAYLTTQTTTTYGTSFTVTTLPATTPTGTNCRLNKITTGTGSSVSESVFNTDNTGKLLRINGNPFNYDVSGNLVSVRVAASSTATTYSTISFKYTNGRLSEALLQSVSAGKTEDSYRYDLTLNNAGRIIRVDAYDDKATPSANEIYALFGYDAADNVVKLTTFILGKQEVVQTMSYDNQKNYTTGLTLSEAHRFFFLLLNNVPSEVGRNNLLSFQSVDATGKITDQYTRQYQYNTNGFPIRITTTTSSYTDVATVSYSNCP